MMVKKMGWVGWDGGVNVQVFGDPRGRWFRGEAERRLGSDSHRLAVLLLLRLSLFCLFLQFQLLFLQLFHLLLQSVLLLLLGQRQGPVLARRGTVQSSSLRRRDDHSWIGGRNSAVEGVGQHTAFRMLEVTVGSRARSSITAWGTWIGVEESTPNLGTGCAISALSCRRGLMVNNWWGNGTVLFQSYKKTIIRCFGSRDTR